MEKHAKVVVIGGGVVGCSILYHLSKFGLKDCILLERKELTSGSSWHAAGNVHVISSDPNISRMMAYTIGLYKEIEKESGHSTGFKPSGGFYLASNEVWSDYLKRERSKARYMGLDQEFISLEEVKKKHPLIDPKKYLLALWDPIDGEVDPSGVTYAFAKAAKVFGGKYYTNTLVTDTKQKNDETWNVITDKGNINAEIVINAGGLWAREVGKLAGIDLPVQPMEHHYLITESIPEIEAMGNEKRLPIGTDFEGNIYFRQEAKGMLLGTYEQKSTPWKIKGTPMNFGHELLEPKLENIQDRLAIGFKRMPALERAGIKNIINGPFTFGPDGSPLIGPVPGKKNYWVAVGVMAGFCQGGGVGKCIAEWIVDGEPSIDVWAMDVARYGDWATLAYTNKKVQENYSRRFSIRFPNEELPAGRPLRTTPIYDRLLAAGAQMGEAYGLEQALWFAPEGIVDDFSWRRSTDFEHVAQEAKAVRNAVGMMEISSFAKYTIRGLGAPDWLDHLLACRLPVEGRMTLAPMLNRAGKLIGDFSLANLGDGEYFIAGSGLAENYHMRWFTQNLPDDGSVEIIARGAGLVGLSIAGPKSRELLQRLVDEDVGKQAFRFLDIRKLDVGMAPCLIGRVSFTGDLGYEIWMEPEYQRYVFDLIQSQGEDLGLRLFGSRALNSLRVEKNFGSWAREYRPVYGPYEAGMGRFVALKKEADFIGKAGAAAEKENGGKLQLRVFVVEAKDADAIGDEPIRYEGEVKGWVTSGGYAHASGVSVAMGYVAKEIADKQYGWSIDILGETLPAAPQTEPLFDPSAERMRG